MTGHRIERANSFIQQELTLALRNQARDPRIEPLSVSEVRLTPDRRIARVYVACYSGDEALDEGLVALEAAKGFLRSHLAQHLHWRFTPEIEFRPDRSWERGARIEALLEQIAEENSGRIPEDTDGDQDDRESAAEDQA